HFSRMGALDEEIYLHFGSSPEDALPGLEAAITTYKPALVIIDPLMRFIRVRDSNDYAEMTRNMEPLMTMARVSGTHILCVHHAGKGDREGGDSILGSTAIFGSVDTALIMRKKGAGRTLESIQRYGEDLPETVIGLDGETGRGAAIAGLHRRRCDIAAKAHRHIGHINRHRFLKDDGEGIALDLHFIADTAGPVEDDAAERGMQAGAHADGRQGLRGRPIRPGRGGGRRLLGEGTGRHRRQAHPRRHRQRDRQPRYGPVPSLQTPHDPKPSASGSSISTSTRRLFA
ncbi:MAG: hypothetical protein CMO29_02760, partial [Tistrella sp.]|nr:hypothetical protein [Tistrella sp.]